MSHPVISPEHQRRLFLHLQGLSEPRQKLDKTELQDLIERMGFVQVDSINTVARAHDMILFSRNQTYRPKQLKALLEKDRGLFENWTHDASILPARFFPQWRRRFHREEERLKERWRRWHTPEFENFLDHVIERIETEGPLRSRDLEKDETKGSGGWWDWHPSKTALEYHWRTGRLAVTGREGFQKVYDLAERVIPEEHHDADPPHEEELIDWACRAALERLGVATHGELAQFWNLISPAEAKNWAEWHIGKDIIEVEAGALDGSRPRKALAFPDIEARLAAAPAPRSSLRVLSPFDPVLRDRKRANRLFDFDYRIEIFVPAPQRTYGYYVFPLIEGERIVGRIDMKADREAGALNVLGLWWEPGLRPSKARQAKLETELDRVRRFAGLERVEWVNLQTSS